MSIHKRIEISKKYLFGIIRYERIGSISCITALNYVIYERIGNVKAIFSVAWESNKYIQ